MTNLQLQEAFEIEIGMLDNNIEKPKSADIEWWLNAGLEKFAKTRYSGLNVKQLSFEQNQKRIDDLRTLVTTVDMDVHTIDKSTYCVHLPFNYLLLLGDRAGILPLDGEENECWSKDDDGNYIPRYADTLEATVEDIDRQRNNSLSEHRLKYCQARPLKLVQGNDILLFTDGKYKVSGYKLTYLRRPKRINIHIDPMAWFSEMPEHTHSEIVKIAAQMYLENQSNSRLQTHANEVAEME